MECSFGWFKVAGPSVLSEDRVHTSPLCSPQGTAKSGHGCSCKHFLALSFQEHLALPEATQRRNGQCGDFLHRVWTWRIPLELVKAIEEHFIPEHFLKSSPYLDYSFLTLRRVPSSCPREKLLSLSGWDFLTELSSNHLFYTFSFTFEKGMFHSGCMLLSGTSLGDFLNLKRW